MREVALVPLMLLAGAAARDDVPPATPAGPPQDCIPLATMDQSFVRSDSVIDFQTRMRKIYRVQLPEACPELGSERRFAYQTSLSKLCATDIITVIHGVPIGPGASCRLALFQPVTLVKARR